ncbi:MAG: caspase domain-containing protein [Anaerolineae bacterium]
MSKNIYALLVAIDEYHPDSNIPHLAGCKNDISRINTFLTERIGNTYSSQILTDEQATKQNVIDGFYELKAKATADDAILFYYSGHGSQSMTAREFWHIEPDKLDETIVAYDSRAPKGNDLADKELAFLIHELAQTGAHITAIMDCCHSGSGTRDITAGVTSRRVATDTRNRSLDGYFFMKGKDPSKMMKKNSSSLSGWFDLPSGDHILLSACRSEQTAKEKVIEGEQRGIFSHYFLETLQSAGSQITYRDIYMRANALVRANVAEQSPQMDTTGEVNLNQPFLGGAIQELPDYYTLAFNRDSKKGKDEGWQIDAGAVNGIKRISSDETTVLGIYSFDASADTLREVDKALAFVKVTSTLPTRSHVELVAENQQEGFSLNEATTYKAIVTDTPIVPLLVALKGDEKACQLVRDALQTAGSKQQSSLTVKEVTDGTESFLVTAENKEFVIQRIQDGYPLVEGTREYSKDSAATVVSRLEHIARWHNLLSLTNPQTKLDSSKIEIRIKVRNDEGKFVEAKQNTDINLYSKGPEEGDEAMMEIRVANKTKQRLFFVFLIFGEAYDITSLTDGNQINGKWLEPGEKFYPLEGEVPAYIEEDQWERGIYKLDHTMKLIVTTEENFASYYVQDELPISAQVEPATRAIGRRRSGTRPDWVTIETAFTVHQPKGETLPTVSRSLSPQNIGITIEGHSGLTGTAELSALPVASRSTQNNTLPPLLRDNPDLFEPFELTSSRGGSSGLSILELSEVTELEPVTPDNPLKITLDGDLEENETLLAIGKVDDDFVVLDVATYSEDGQIALTIDQLPSKAEIARYGRGIHDGVRIIFQKYSSQNHATPYTFTRKTPIKSIE